MILDFTRVPFVVVVIIIIIITVIVANMSYILISEIIFK